ncbi:MAG TPA: sulfotransferase domain-containing protein [Metabacillus sp.]|nr:sulfotransferase domain-containing protein [Metabacillus sp.]
MTKIFPSTVRDDDTFIIAYPRSGSNFMLFLIGSLYFQKKIDWFNRDIIPSIEDEEIVLKTPSPRIMWGHSAYDSRYKKVIYIVRDPRDVIISYYYWCLKFDLKNRSSLSFNMFFERFLSGELWPLTRWDNHVSSWIDNKKYVEKGFLIVKYEDLLTNIHHEIKRIIAFLDLVRTDEEIAQVVEWCSFENMRKLEKQQNNAPFFKNSDKGIPFVRQGKANAWNSFLSIEQQEKINFSFHSVMRNLGYLE